MSFPNSADKHAGQPFVTPGRLLEHLTGRGARRDRQPRCVVLSWQAELTALVRERRDCTETSGPGRDTLRLSLDLGFARLGLGAPACGIALEELAFLGVEAVIGVGTSGAIGGGLRPADAVVCSAALRDEGTSYHYAPPARFAAPDPQLTSRLRSSMPSAAYCPTWTTDAPYRETTEEIARYQSEGILTVEMEAAALFTVAGVLGLRAAAAFCISDVLHGTEWEPHFGTPAVNQTLWDLFEAAEACLTRPRGRRAAMSG